MIYEIKIAIYAIDSNTMKHGNVRNNLPAMNVYVVTHGLTKHKKKFRPIFPTNWRVFDLHNIFNPYPSNVVNIVSS
jgi:hypothetical protein